MTAMTASDAAAQDAEPSGAWHTEQEQPPPHRVAPGAESRFVRVEIRSWEGTRARISGSRADGSYPILCETPCAQDLLPGIVLRIVVERSACESEGRGECDATAWDERNVRTYVVPNRPGHEVHLTVGPASSRNVGFVVGGSLIAIAGAAAIVGGAIVAKDGGGGSGGGAFPGGDVVGPAIVVMGVCAVITGLLFIALGPSSLPAVRRERAERPRVQLSADARGIGFTFSTSTQRLRPIAGRRLRRRRYPCASPTTRSA